MRKPRSAKKRARPVNRLAEVGEVAIRLRVSALEGGGYVATSPDLPGLVAEGRSVTEAVEIAQGLGRKLLESCIEHGDPLPPAFARTRPEPRDFIVPVAIGR
ncbi:MAG: type II toxin-antitoxin system HicB family antitoxin [Acidobacteria bacterium]|nr:type II toxin-antitoxin system HicB family antitoxin [Acidobacteriota bacterium]